MSDGEIFFRAETLQVSFESRRILEDFSLRMREGETLGLIGSSGCGKTTLFNVLSGILAPSSGRILLRQPAGEHTAFAEITGQKRFCAYMFQDHTLLPWRTLIKNVMLPGEVDGNGDETVLQQRALTLLDAFGLSQSVNLYPDQLSGGMRQRGAFARTFMSERPLYLLDEPFSSLDYLRQLKMERMLRSFLTQHRKSCILVTHDIEAALALCHRVLVLSGPPLVIRNEIVTGLDTLWHDPIDARETDLFASIHKSVVETLREILDENKITHA